ncbi:hypothetical protein B0T26DRAFT_674337 [Lasiosphaeria miniovina]|uniref:Uncharacterized protein n=1 Tax=Lasiosphaeria miniovina TaxID=1954250 RepID=A0AA40DZU3_9PEZI|nr:uncharacterized protein B0T26DRAFT_674337 [Lasiosphaeria miniovina]KAK0722659.1 hypothetical protein B0T26DRAFT_674337 [Lasiosphaeria miniovina]
MGCAPSKPDQLPVSPAEYKRRKEEERKRQKEERKKGKMQATIIKKTTTLKKIDHTMLHEVNDQKPDDPANKKFKKFEHWLSNEYHIPDGVHLNVIRQCKGLGRDWARLEVESTQEALCLHDNLSRKYCVPRYRDELKLCYLIERLVFSTLGTPGVFPVAPGAVAESLCGQLARLKSGSDSSVVSTIGGLVKNNADGSLWALTAKHAPRPIGEVSKPKLRDASDIEPDDYDAKKIKSLWAFPTKQMAAAAPPRAAATTPIPFGFDEEIDIGLECRLIRVGKPDLMLPNCFKLERGRRHESLQCDNHEPKPQAGRVAVLSGASGCHFMNMLQNKVSICLPSGKWEEAWALEPEEEGGRVMVREGDSGSWVVHPDRGSVFGIVIASTSHTVYLIPLKNVLKRATYHGNLDDENSHGGNPHDDGNSHD